MKQDSVLAKEIALLRAEVEAIRHQQIESVKQKETMKKPKRNVNKETKVEADSEQTVQDLFATVLEHAKQNYEHLSPASTLLLFALGAVFGSILSKHNGAKS